MAEKLTTFIFCVLTLTAVLLVAVVIDLTHITIQTRRELETVTVKVSLLSDQQKLDVKSNDDKIRLLESQVQFFLSGQWK